MIHAIRKITQGTAAFAILGAAILHAQQPAPENPPSKPPVELPMDRTAYFIGEQVPLAVSGPEDVKLEAVNADGRTLLYSGKPAALWLDTTRLAPGDYALELNGVKVIDRFTLTSPLRKSAGSMQDEVTPPATMSSDEIAKVFAESGLTACLELGASDMGRATYLDAMARTGAFLLVNPDTRPTSFLPVWNNPQELDGMSQRMILTAQANGRYPNFGGFCYGWDTTAYAVGSRRMLLTYWGWADMTQQLRNYIERVDKQKMEEFTKRTGMQPVSEPEYIAYLLSIKRPEFAPAIDLPTKLWLEEIAKYTEPMSDPERIQFEKRLDAWSAYLMGLYNECYSTYSKNLASVDPALRSTSSVQVDHAATRSGQYFPSAYSPLDLHYQSTWNDQVGGPDYAYQWLLTAGILDMQRGDKPVWISNAIGMAHGRSMVPGKFLKVAAHNLAWGGSGIGFALEGFSNVLGGMNKESTWEEIKGKSGESEVRAGREFMDRFATLATDGHGDYGVGVLFSKTQYGRQHVVMSGSAPVIQAFVTLVRLGYTPQLVTEDDLSSGKANGLKALVVIGQQFPLPEKTMSEMAAFVKNGGRILVDGNTTLALPGAEKLGMTYPLSQLGKPHSWGAPNMIEGDNDTLMFARQYAIDAPAFAAALGDTGRGIFRSEKGVKSDITLTQITGGKAAKYVVAINDSHIATQADWYQVQEKLIPSGEGWLYDCMEEKSLGKLAPVTCDLMQTTARVYAVLSSELKNVSISATQSVTAGNDLCLQVEFHDAAEQRIAAVLPFYLTVMQPDGKVQQEYYRATTSEGTFSITLPIPANAPAGQWSVAVRSQLNGDVATLPVTVAAANAPEFTSAITEPVVVRGRTAAETMLANGAKVILPVFDAQLQSVAEKVKTVLAGRGVTVEIWQNPPIATYTLGYDPNEAELQENKRIDDGTAIGKIKRTTINGNDWYSGLSGYRLGASLILLDLSTSKGNRTMVEDLDKSGILWPQVTDAFPGKGRAVVQAVPWAFGPRMTTLVIQATDVEGLMAGAQSLANLPEDRITQGITATKTGLWKQYHVGGIPEQVASGKLTSNGLQTKQAPDPFKLRFVGNDKPLSADQVKHAAPVVHPAIALPAIFEPKQCVIYYRDGDKYIESATAEFLMADLRFSEALMLVVDVKQAGKFKITAEGVFRYSDRQPCWQAQWEDIINLREKLVPKERRPIEIEVQVDGKSSGKLIAAKTEQKEVPLELASPSAGLKPKSVVEEVVTEITGEVELPAGRHEIMLIHRNIVDGKLAKILVNP